MSRHEKGIQDKVDHSDIPSIALGSKVGLLVSIISFGRCGVPERETFVVDWARSCFVNFSHCVLAKVA